MRLKRYKSCKDSIRGHQNFVPECQWGCILNVIQPNCNLNMICFISRNILNQARYGSSFGRQLSISQFLPFRVTWRLTWDFAHAGKLAAVDKKWVEIVFEAPEVSLGSFKMQYGGNSTVKLAILYLDDVVRIGRGSRGSLFIFKRRTWASFYWILSLSLIMIVYTRLLQSISSVCSLSFHDQNDGCDMLTDVVILDTIWDLFQMARVAESNESRASTTLSFILIE